MPACRTGRQHSLMSLSRLFVLLPLLISPTFGANILFPRDDSTALPAVDEPPCTITSPHTGSFFDLRPLIRQSQVASSDDADDANEWTTSGHDYNTTFHLNICNTVLSDVSRARGSPPPANISAFYERDGDVFSLGESSSILILRGKKLILEYTNGSPCAPDSTKEFRKSTLISFLCDRELGVGKADVAYVGQSNDCAYFFEIRTSAACATTRTAEGGGLSPGAIFAVIMGVFFAVYCVGGCVYQRTVMNARGWRQVPHYHTWAYLMRGIQSFFSILTSPLSRRGTTSTLSSSGSLRLPQQHNRHSSTDHRNQPTAPGANSSLNSFSRRLSGFGNSASAYSQWGSWGTRSGRAGPVWARGVDEDDADGEVEDENRLLDQLEGEWDD